MIVATRRQAPQDPSSPINFVEITIGDADILKCQETPGPCLSTVEKNNAVHSYDSRRCPVHVMTEGDIGHYFRFRKNRQVTRFWLSFPPIKNSWFVLRKLIWRYILVQS